MVGLLALLWAESNLNPWAVRQAVWPDWSAGMAQISCQLGPLFDVGDGTPSSWPAFKAAMLDRATSIDCGARYYASKLADLRAAHPDLGGDTLMLAGLIRYNGGPWPIEDWYTRLYPSNLARYEQGLEWASSLLS